nr:hypothetical protein MFLOJ_22500 [Mycobacterium florentinum]
MPDGVWRGPGLPIFTSLIIAQIAIVANVTKSDEQLNMAVFSTGTAIARPTCQIGKRGR